MSTTIYIFMENSEKYQNVWLKKVSYLEVCRNVGVISQFTGHFKLSGCCIMVSFKVEFCLSVAYLGPVVQSVVSLTTSLRVISLTVLADPIHNILIFFAEKM